MVRHVALMLSLSACVLFPAQRSESQSVLEEAAQAFERGNTAEAEQKVRSVLDKHPSDLRALLLIAAVLDSRRRYSEAESYYQRALEIAPASARLLNNVANHYLAAGNRSKAREFYAKALTADPRHLNANLQLARMSVEEKRGRQALQYLNRLGNSVEADPVVLELRAHALALAGECSEAAAVVSRFESRPAADWRIPFSAGSVYASCKLYDRAEASFSRAFDAEPRNFDILYNLGLAALHAGHAERAAGVFEVALNEHPDDVDCLSGLSQAYLKSDKTVEAVALLAKAAKLAPRRADVLLLLAQISAQLEFHQDAAATYARYLELKPADELARRERAFALANAGQFRRALPDLEAYTRKHPRDAKGFYEAAIAQAFEHQGRALLSLNRALALDPRLHEARYTRAMLQTEQGMPAAAIDDLRLLLEKQPRNYSVLVRLGQAYLMLDRPGDAEHILKQALDVAPNGQWAITMYCRALEKLGRTQEAASFRRRLPSGPSDRAPGSRTGLIEYLSLKPAEQRERYLANLRKNTSYDPDYHWRMRLGRELLLDGKASEALEIFRGIRSATTSPEVLGRCGTVLLEFEQYEPAREFLESAVAAASSPGAYRLELSTVLFHLQGAEAALRELDKTDEADRTGDYFLLRAQLLDALGRIPEASEALNLGMRAAPTKAGLYFQAASFLLKHRLPKEALALLEQANNLVPDARELLLARSVTLILLHRENEAVEVLKRIQTRWPEWDRPYLLRGILLELQLQSAEARRSLETAIALGANTPEAYYYHALAITHAAPDDLPAAEQAIGRALALTSNDPYVYLLAGKISLAKKDYPNAIRHLVEATRLQPSLIPARYALRTAYKAMGDEQKSAAELEQIKRIGRENAASDHPFAAENFLFTVRPPL